MGLCQTSDKEGWRRVEVKREERRREEERRKEEDKIEKKRKKERMVGWVTWSLGQTELS